VEALGRRLDERDEDDEGLEDEILPCPELDQQYGNPDRDLATRIDAGEWPPK
jgi:hypothetical protein